MTEARSPVHVRRVEYLSAVTQQITIDLQAWFPVTREGFLVALTELDIAYDEARQQLVGYIEGNT